MNAYYNPEFMDRCNPLAGFWSSKGSDFDEKWTLASSRVSFGRLKPGRIYTKRSTKLAQLRHEAATLSRLDFEEVTPPSAVSMHAAQTFINNLCEGCLNFDLEVSHDGEINFLYGQGAELFHIHIDELGVLSYYSRQGDQEMFGDDMSPADFPHQELLHFVDRRK